MRSLLLALLFVPALFAQAPITVTVYDLAGLPPETRRSFTVEAGRILLQSGVEVEWILCEAAGQPTNHPGCAFRLTPRRFMLQLAAGRNRTNPRSSGFASIQKNASVFACLYPDRLRDLANDANWEFADLLGHAAAHELGHLLLQSADHSSAGIMRARWETDDLRRLSHNGLVFLSGQLDGAAVRFSGTH